MGLERLAYRSRASVGEGIVGASLDDAQLVRARRFKRQARTSVTRSVASLPFDKPTSCYLDIYKYIERVDLFLLFSLA